MSTNYEVPHCATSYIPPSDTRMMIMMIIQFSPLFLSPASTPKRPSADKTHKYISQLTTQRIYIKNNNRDVI
jgi:hypothetical protein